MNTKNEYGQFMARKHKKMALYEVFSRSVSNSRKSKSLERLHPAESSSAGTVKADVRPIQKPVVSAVLKPKMMQINRGRIEISMPYQLAVAVLLGLILLLLIAFQLGRHQEINDMAVSVKVSDEPIVYNSPEPVASETEEIKPLSEQASVVETLESTGNNRIVIQTWKDENQLIPVQQYFSGQGIETEIRKVGQMYYLVTKARYENPQKPGTDGYKARQRIVELGAGYMPPPGYGSFDFSSAYGKKFED